MGSHQILNLTDQLIKEKFFRSSLKRNKRNTKNRGAGRRRSFCIATSVFTFKPTFTSRRPSKTTTLLVIIRTPITIGRNDQNGGPGEDLALIVWNSACADPDVTVHVMKDDSILC